MKSYTVAIEIDLPRDRVIELFDDPDNQAKWQTGLQSFEPISGEPGQVGARSRLVFLSGKQRIELVETITWRGPPDEFRGTYEWGGGSSTLENRFIEVGPQRTRWESTCTFLRRSFPLRVIALLVPGVFKRQNLEFLESFYVFAEEGRDVRGS